MASVAEGAARGAIWNVGSTLVTRGATLASTLLLTRFISPTEFGETSAAFVCVLTVVSVVHLRMGQYLIAKQAGHEDAFNANVAHVGLGALALVPIVVFREEIAPFFGAPGIARFIPGFALVALIERLYYVAERVLTRDLEFRPLSIARSAGELTYSGVALATAPFIGGMAIVYGSLLRSTVLAVMILRAAGREGYRPRIPLRWSRLRAMFVYCAPLMISALAEMGAVRWDNLLMARYFGPRQLGWYNLAYNLADMPTGAVGEQLSDVLFPSFSKLPPERREAALLRATWLLALVVFPLAIGLAAVAPTLVDVFFDDRWAAIAPMLVVLSLLSVMRPLAMPPWAFLAAQHRQRALMVISVAKVGLVLGGIFVFARFGPLWTCFGVAAAFALDALLCIVLARVLEKVRILPFLFGLVPVLIACSVMGGGVTALRLTLQGIPAVASLALQVLAGAVLYVAAAFVVARPLAMDLVTQLKNTIARKRGQAAEET